MLRRMRLGVIFGVALLGLLPESASAEIRIGLAAPLSGRQAAQGLAMQSALVAAVAEVNAGGGVRGEPLVLDVEDDGCARATGEGAARALAARAPLLVIGHPCSSAATVAAPIYAAAKVLFIAVGPRHTDVTQGGLTSPILRLAGRDNRQGDAAARWLLAHAPSRRVAIVQDRTAYARAIAERTASVLKDAAAELATVFPIVAGKQSYADAIARVGEMTTSHGLTCSPPGHCVPLSNRKRSDELRHSESFEHRIPPLALPTTQRRPSTRSASSKCHRRATIKLQVWRGNGIGQCPMRALSHPMWERRATQVLGLQVPRVSAYPQVRHFQSYATRAGHG